MIVTINTDASWSPGHLKASYAFWIKSDFGKIARSGMLKGRTVDADFAEFKCILNALYCLFSSAEWNGYEKIIVNTDSMNAIHVFTQNKRAINKYRIDGWHKHYYLEYSIMKSKFRKSNVQIEFRHVKAHKGTSTKRAWVNDWCDREAKAQLIRWHKIRKGEL